MNSATCAGLLVPCVPDRLWGFMLRLATFDGQRARRIEAKLTCRLKKGIRARLAQAGVIFAPGPKAKWASIQVILPGLSLHVPGRMFDSNQRQAWE